MSTPAIRRFNLIDAMVLVAATAGGLALYRPEPRGPRAIVYTRAVLLPCGVACTFATLALRLRAPRPGLARLSRQPGFVACLAACTGQLVGLADRAASVLIAWARYGFRSAPLLRDQGHPSWPSAIRAYVLVPGDAGVYYTGAAVLAAWSVLAVSRRWRGDGSWVDRAGVAAGVFWAAMIPVGWFVQDYLRVRI